MSQPPVPSVLPSLPVITLIFRATVREMLRRKILIFLGLLCSIPLILTIIWRMVGSDLGAEAFFTNLTSGLYLGVLVYVVGLAFGIPTIHSEVEGRTITYLLTRPIRKQDIYIGRLLAVQLTAGGLLAASLVGCFALMVFGNFGVLSVDFIKAYLNHVIIVLVATVCVTAVCAVVGTALKRPVVWGLLWAFGWEQVISNFAGRLPNFTISYHIRNLFMGDTDVRQNLVGALRELLASGQQTDPWMSVVALGIFLVAAVWAGSTLFARREYVIN